MPEPALHEEIIQKIKAGNGDGMDLSGLDLSSINLSGLHLKGVVLSNFHTNKITDLTNANLKDCTLEDVKLSGAVLSGTTFRNCRLKWCDFRYIRCSQSTFQDAHLFGCDFYRANFEGYSIFEGANLTGVSLFMANLQGAGLRRYNLGDKLLQEDKILFEEFHFHYLNVNVEQIQDLLNKRHYEAMQIYRHLTGVWTSQGFFQDAGWAYVKSKRNEKITFAPRYASKVYPVKDNGAAAKKSTRSAWITLAYLPKFISYWIVDLICGFGESLGKLIASILFLLFGSACVYWVFRLLESPQGNAYTGFGDYLIFSLGNLTATDYGRFIASNQIAELMIAFQALLGIALVGLLGFVLGNKIRNA